MSSSRNRSKSFQEEARAIACHLFSDTGTRMLLIQLLCAGILVTASSAQNFTWTGLTADSSSQPPAARHSAAMGATTESQFYVFGGRGNKDNGTEVFSEITIYISLHLYFHEFYELISLAEFRKSIYSFKIYKLNSAY